MREIFKLIDVDGCLAREPVGGCEGAASGIRHPPMAVTNKKDPAEIPGFEKA